jgi:hypothetical protein
MVYVHFDVANVVIFVNIHMFCEYLYFNTN